MRTSPLVLAMCAVASLASAAPADPPDLRIGLIGLDTSHVVEFTRLFNDPKTPGHLAGAKVVAAVKSGSPDLPQSASRIDRYTADVTTKYGVKLCATVAELLPLVDAVMIENVDGRKHLEIAREVFPAGKPVFIDKPLAGTLADGIAIARLAQQHHVPFFSASSLRFAPAITAWPAEQRGAIRSLMAYTPCELEPHHPDLFWYGVHGVETIYAIIGTGCTAVGRLQTDDAEVVTGRWRDGRIGILYGYRRANPGYGFSAVLHDGVKNENYKADYLPLVQAVLKFFQTRVAPVTPEEMIEVLAFMEAADESKRQGGALVEIAEVIRRHGGPATAVR